MRPCAVREAKETNGGRDSFFLLSEWWRRMQTENTDTQDFPWEADLRITMLGGEERFVWSQAVTTQSQTTLFRRSWWAEPREEGWKRWDILSPFLHRSAAVKVLVFTEAHHQETFKLIQGAEPGFPHSLSCCYILNRLYRWYRYRNSHKSGQDTLDS